MTHLQYKLKALFAIFLLLFISALSAEKYVIDTTGTHAFIQFKISHLGYSWLYGRFNKFSGEFEYDEDHPERSTVVVNIKTSSIDSNHALRDKHIRGKKYLDVKKHPKAKFISTSYTENPDGSAVLKGKFTLKGITKPVMIDAVKVGAGKDPWGGYRRGFEGTTTLNLADFGIGTKALGEHSQTLELTLSLEGIRQADELLTN